MARLVTPHLILLMFATCVFGDTLLVTMNGATTSFADVKVTKVEGGQVWFVTTSGAEVARPLASIVQAAIDDEPGFSRAEEAASAKRYDAATDLYLKAMESTNKAWLREWAAERILNVAPQANRFDAAAAGYIAIALVNPKEAMQKKPALPAGTSTFLETATSDLDSALKAPNLTDDKRLALLSLELDIARARNDSTKASAVIDQLAQLKTPAAGAISSVNILAYQKLEAAKSALEKKDYKNAIATIEAAKDAFREPAQQADALYLCAQARRGIANQTRDAADLKDAAIAYLRVTSHFQDLPTTPHVAESYLAAGAIMEQLNDAKGAAALYQEVISRYNTQPAAEEARQALSRLKSVSTKPGSMQ